MAIIYKYQKTEYASIWALKRAHPELIFPDTSDEVLSMVGIEKIEQPDPVPTEPTLEEIKTSKLKELESAFLAWYEEDAVVISSLGFVADSDARAIMDVTGLVTVLEATPEETRGTVAFMDHDNHPHMLTIEQIKTIQLEIIQNGQAAYQQKWAFRTQIEAAKDSNAINSIVITFAPMNFLQD